MLENLDNRDLLDRAVAPLARRFGFEPAVARECLANHQGQLGAMLSAIDDPGTRQLVNQWWRGHRSEFNELGLGVLLRATSPSKLPLPTYEQVICLSWLTRELMAKRVKATQEALRARRVMPPKREVRILEPRPIKAKASWWGRALSWLKKLIGGSD